MRGVESVVNLADELGISIPVGKDSLSMKVSWKDDSDKEITSPMTLNMSVFSNVKDLRQSVTPELSNKDSTLLHIWMNDSDFRMGGVAYTRLMVFMEENRQILRNLDNSKDYLIPHKSC